MNGLHTHRLVSIFKRAGHFGVAHFLLDVGYERVEIRFHTLVMQMQAHKRAQKINSKLTVVKMIEQS